MDVTRKSIGILIDDLITTSQKLFYLQEVYNKPGVTNEELGSIFTRIQVLNVRRNELINAIDNYLNPTIASTTEKTYK